MKKRRGRGRPTKCTPEMTERYCRALLQSLHLATAAALCGLDEETPREWLRRGERELERILNSPWEKRAGPSEEPFVYFSSRVSETLAMQEAVLVAEVTKRDPGWILSRRWRDNWGPAASQTHRRAIRR